MVRGQGTISTKRIRPATSPLGLKALCAALKVSPTRDIEVGSARGTADTIRPACPALPDTTAEDDLQHLVPQLTGVHHQHTQSKLRWSE